MRFIGSSRRWNQTGLAGVKHGRALRGKRYRAADADEDRPTGSAGCGRTRVKWTLG